MRGVGLGDLLEREHVGESVQSCPAVLLRYFDPHQAQGTHLAYSCFRGFPALIEPRRNGRDLALGEIPRRLTDQLMFRREAQTGTVCDALEDSHRATLLAGSGQSEAIIACPL